MQLTNSKNFKVPFKVGELVSLLDNDKLGHYGIVMGYGHNYFGALIVKVLWNKKLSSLNPRWMFPDTLRIAVK